MRKQEYCFSFSHEKNNLSQLLKTIGKLLMVWPKINENTIYSNTSENYYIPNVLDFAYKQDIWSCYIVTTLGKQFKSIRAHPDRTDYKHKRDYVFFPLSKI